MLLLTNEALCKLNIRIKKYIDEIHFTSTAFVKIHSHSIHSLIIFGIYLKQHSL